MRKEGPAPAQCQPRWGGCFFLRIFLPPRALLCARSRQNPCAGERGHGEDHTTKPGAPGSYLGADNGEEGTCPSSQWEPGSSVSRGFSPCTAQDTREDFSSPPAPAGWVLIGICSAQLLHILFFNLPHADVFLSVPRSNLLALPLAVTRCRWDMDTRWRCVTSEPTSVLGSWNDNSPQHVAGTGQGALDPRASSVGQTGFPGAGAREGDGLGAHPVPCLSCQIPLSLHSPACKTSPGPPKWFLRAGSPPVPLGKGCLLESSIPRL